MSLNLARILRPKKFSQIIGQELVKSMLKNSLFTGKIFPTYLFYGSRGCGKTTTARVFAASLNCLKLEEFRKNPKIEFPCAECTSCLQTRNGTHPDFIEIDAASNTGVDNIRNIVESANYVPRQGLKKIYLIDEAHMLSKSAFNALLKMLEEPPKTSLFVLATTEYEKIPATVRSRCFHGKFMPLEFNQIKEALTLVCQAEKINLSEKKIAAIARSSQGFIRDAINFLEQVWIAEKNGQTQHVEELLGLNLQTSIIKIFQAIAEKDTTKIFEEINQSDFYQHDAKQILNNFILLLSQTLKAFLKIKTKKNSFYGYEEEIKNISKTMTIERLNSIMQLTYNKERGLFYTKNKHEFLEHMFLQMANQIDLEPINKIIKKIEKQIDLKNVETIPSNDKKNNAVEKKITKPTPQVKSEKKEAPEKIDTELEIPESWKEILQNEAIKEDKILYAIFQNARAVKQNGSDLEICLPKLSGMFFEKIQESKKTWLEIVNAKFKNTNNIKLLSLNETKNLQNKQKVDLQKTSPEVIKNSSNSSATPKENKPKTNSSKLDTSNKDEWPRVNLVLKYFPGKAELDK